MSNVTSMITDQEIEEFFAAVLLAVGSMDAWATTSSVEDAQKKREYQTLRYAHFKGKVQFITASGDQDNPVMMPKDSRLHVWAYRYWCNEGRSI